MFTKSILVRTTWHLDNRWDVLVAAFCDVFKHNWLVGWWSVVNGADRSSLFLHWSTFFMNFCIQLCSCFMLLFCIWLVFLHSNLFILNFCINLQSFYFCLQLYCSSAFICIHIVLQHLYAFICIHHVLLHSYALICNHMYSYCTLAFIEMHLMRKGGEGILS